ncbi:glycogen-binding domain-containing protein [Bythopirellula goksoeyrii]|uniref:Glycogen branching enzyme n=1 Tax=Bythopirellula goksoeyrii TaxID=1400387 RepID=A0A5B9QDT8_9BACT|nr:glycogen-binding domain-containing protein [Bythopirellula goksoeyrii]QEG35795.1 glycogen branching enzyme [Bythopirellula goksoeyrii]
MSKVKAKLTQFSCHAPDASAVFLAGTFNDWQTDATPLANVDQGNWKVQMELAPGHYEYKFFVDGQWCCEPGCQPLEACPKCVSNSFGTMNRFMDIE